jgi:hypothetical protein
VSFTPCFLVVPFECGGRPRRPRLPLGDGPRVPVLGPTTVPPLGRLLCPPWADYCFPPGPTLPTCSRSVGGVTTAAPGRGRGVWCWRVSMQSPVSLTAKHCQRMSTDVLASPAPPARATAARRRLRSEPPGRERGNKARDKSSLGAEQRQGAAGLNQEGHSLLGRTAPLSSVRSSTWVRRGVHTARLVLDATCRRRGAARAGPRTLVRARSRLRAGPGVATAAPLGAVDRRQGPAKRARALGEARAEAGSRARPPSKV